MKLTGTIGQLKKKSKMVTEDITEFSKNFEEFILNKKCAALAASQVGVFSRVVGVKSRSRKRVCIMINPVIIKASKHVITKPESCISLGSSTKEVERPLWVTIAYQTPNLKTTKHKTFYGRRAAAACHVVDMLDGILIK